MQTLNNEAIETSPAPTNPSLDMRHAQPLAPALVAQLLPLAEQLRTAGHGGKTVLVDAFAAQYGWSAQRVWGYLERVGYTTQRKKRLDAGTTRLPEETMNFIAASKHASVRANGKSTKPTCVAMNIADASGMTVNVTEGTINRLLRERKLDVKSQAVARNTITTRSLHPNHQHQIDPSLCLVYYLAGKQRVISEAEFYKNKLEGMAKIKLKVWRYTRWDKASSTIDVRYYEAAGENQHTLFDFLQYTWGKQPNRLSHGVPKMLYWDKGSANTSHAVQNLLDALGVEHTTHAVQHAWATGGVEGAQNIVQNHFESRLRDEPVDNIDQLNAAAENWVRDYNANAIKFIDSRIVRASGVPMVRDDLWHTITADQLVAMPPREVCAWFMTAKAETRQVRNLHISFAHPQAKKDGMPPMQYDLSPWARDIANKDTVLVAPLLMGSYSARITLERLGREPLVLQVEPVLEYDKFGDPMSAPVVGEAYRQAPLGLAGAATNLIAKTTYGEGANRETMEESRRKNTAPFKHLAEAGTPIRAHSHLGEAELPTRMPRAASELQTTAIDAARSQMHAELAPLTVLDTCKMLKATLGEAYSPAVYAWVAAKYPDNAVPALEAEALAEQWLANLEQATGTNDVAGFSGLRSVK
jgi:hypothetical protein